MAKKKPQVGATVGTAVPIAAPSIVNSMNPQQQANVGLQQQQANLANSAASRAGDLRTQAMANKQALNVAKREFRQTGDRSSVEAARGTLLQSRADLKSARQEQKGAAKAQNVANRYEPQAGNTYAPNQTAIRPTGIVNPVSAPNPGGVAQPLASIGDTVTQGHMQVVAKQNGRTPGDFQSNSEYQGSAPNSFGLGNVGPISSAVTPQLSYVDPNAKGFSPGELVNMQRESDNILSRDNAVREQRATDTLRGGQDAARNLSGQADQINTQGGQQAFNYSNQMGNQSFGFSNQLAGQAGGLSDQIGQQAYNRINQAEQARQSGMQQQMMSRGLGNSTIVSSLGSGIARDAEDSRQGVDEARAGRGIGILTDAANRGTSILGDMSRQGTGVLENQTNRGIGIRSDLAGMERNTAGSIAQAISGQPFNDRASASAQGMGYVKQPTDYASLIGAGVGAAGGLLSGGILPAISGLFGKRK